jgi:hypothetical protein
VNAFLRLTPRLLLVVLLATSAALLAPPAGATEPAERVHGEFVITGDEAGEVAQRLTLDIGSTRWLFRSTASVVAREEVPVAGGYTSRRLEPRSPFTDAEHTAGCEAGPLVMGPLALHGLYRRALDPSAGGLTWSALDEDPRVRLDRGLDGARWSGVAVRTPARAEDSGRSFRLRPGALWMTDDTSTIEIVTLPIGWIRRQGALRGSGVDLSVAAGRSRVLFREEESWLFETPPFLGDRLTIRGASLGARVALPGAGGFTVDTAAEGWEQRSGYRPSRWSGQGWFSGGVRGFTVDGRLSRTDPGFRNLDGGVSSAAAFAGLGARGRYRSVPIVWSAAWEQHQGWDDGVPGDTEEELCASVGVARRRGVLRRLELRGESERRGATSGEGDAERDGGGEGGSDGGSGSSDGGGALAGYAAPVVTARGRLQAGWWWLAAEGTRTAAGLEAGDLDTWRVETWRVETGVRGALGRRGRTASVGVGWRVAPERLRASLSIPVGRLVRIEGSGQAEAYTEEPVWTGSVVARVNW